MRLHRVWLVQVALLTLLLLGQGCSSMPSDFAPDGGVADGAEAPCSCALGSRRCAGTSVEVCEMASGGCAAWGPAVACPSGMCTAGACQGSCQDACPAGMSRCTGGAAVEVCRIGPSGCLEWSMQSCPALQFCDPLQNVCVADVPCDVSCPTGYTCKRGGVCVGGSPTGLVLDVKTVPVSGKVTLNGAAPKNGADCRANPGADKARVTFQSTQGSATFSFPMSCADTDFTFAGTLFPGKYRLSVQGLGGVGSPFSNLPSQDYVFDPAFSVAAAVIDKTVDVKTLHVAGQVTLNGAAPQQSRDCLAAPDAEKARVTFTDSASGYTFDFPIACADDGFAFAGTLYPSTYQVSVQGGASGNIRFSNLPPQRFISDAALHLTGDLTGKTLNVKTVQLSGKVTHNAADAQNSFGCRSNPGADKAQVTLSDATSGARFTLPMSCSDSDFTFTGKLYPGTYRLSVEGLALDGTLLSDLPEASYQIDPAFVIAADVAGKTLDVKTIPVSGKVTVNGVEAKNGPDCSGDPGQDKVEVTFRSDTGATFRSRLSCSDASFDFTTTVYPGTYSVRVAGLSQAGSRVSDIPTVGYLAVASLPISTAITGKTLDVKTVQLTGKLTLNGADTKNGPDCIAEPNADKAEVALFDAANGYGFTIPLSCTSTDFGFAATLYPGTYYVTVRGLRPAGAALSSLPDQAYQADPGLLINTAVSGKVLDVKTVLVGGRVTLNGVDPQNGPDCRALPGQDKVEVGLRELTLGYRFVLPMSCADSGFAFAGAAYPGTYEITVAGLSPGSYRLSNLPAQPSLVSSRLAIP